MSLIEGIGDEVTNLLIIILCSVIVYFAWRSTEVRDERLIRSAVVIIESNRQLLNRVAQLPVAVNILRNASNQHMTLNSSATTTTTTSSGTEAVSETTNTTTTTTTNTTTSANRGNISGDNDVTDDFEEEITDRFQRNGSQVLQLILDNLTDVPTTTFSHFNEPTSRINSNNNNNITTIHNNTSSTSSNDLTPEETIVTQEIIRSMDNLDGLNDGIRRRRLLNQGNNNNIPSTSNNSDDIVDGSSSQIQVSNGTPIISPTLETAAASSSSSSSLSSPPPPSITMRTDDGNDYSNIDNCTNENSENGNVIENIPIDDDMVNITASAGNNSNNRRETRPIPTIIEPTTSQNDNNPDVGNILSKETEIRVKLKYLNDDLKLVKGSPNEPIGDFKKRNFSSELSDQKMVRLVFNGQVLQPDSKTLQSCGLFDNCVVHCLVHKLRPLPNSSSSSTNNNQITLTQSAIGGGGGGNNNNNSTNGTTTTTTATTNFNDGQRLVYLGILLISLTLTFCWYFRIQYNHLFSWYSTIGLILLTILFLVIIPLLYLIEREVTA